MARLRISLRQAVDAYRNRSHPPDPVPGPRRIETDARSGTPGVPALTGLVPHPAGASAHPSERWKTADEWKLRAQCGPGDTALFFSADPADIRAALAICRDCPVRRDCLAEAMAQEQGQGPDDRYGIRGGLLPSERFDAARGGGRRPARPRAGRSKKAGQV